ncbi:MAG: DNA topoisomerase, partial [Clostridiales bacterium]|nr:DNA topoisomerase [Clostridiales bacterium]
VLYKKTKLEDTFGVNMLAIAHGRPETLSLRGILENYLEFQYENTERKYRALLEKELEKKEIREGLIHACDVIDLIIAILRGAKNLKDAKACLTQGDISKIHFRTPGFEEEAKQLRFTEKQATAILEMRLYRLIGLEILALKKEYDECVKKIRQYEKILKSRVNMNQVIKEDLDQIRREFATPRKTRIEDSGQIAYEEAPAQIQEVVFVMDRFGYCKLLDRSVCERNQETLDHDYRYQIPCLSTDKLCIFTDIGNLHQVKVSDIPAGKLRDKGTPIDNLSKYDGSKEEIIFLASLGQMTGQLLLFATRMGMVKQVPAEEFLTNNRTVAATRLADGDRLAVIRIIGAENDLVLQTTGGMFLRFSMEEIPEMKKNSRGVRGIKLGEGDELDAVWFVSLEPQIRYKEKEVSLNRLRIARRDTKGTKVRL